MTTSPPARPAPDYPRHPWLVAFSVLAATFMEVLDTTVVSVALPHMAGSLSATNAEATWTLTSYLVANAIVLPMTGWLARRFGRKNLLLASVTGFTATSLLCGLAGTLPFLVLARVLQGISGGSLQPLSQAVMLESFPPSQRGRAMGFWALGIVVAPMLGPIVGGWITDHWSWHWVFFINIPVGIAALVLIGWNVADPAYLRRDREPVDVGGIVLLVVGIGALQIVLDKGQQVDWFSSKAITALAVVSAAALVALVLRELRTPDPILDLRVFRERTFATGVLLMTCVGLVLYGSLTLLPLLLQTLLGYPAHDAGVTVAPRGFGSFLAMPLIGLIVGRFATRRLLVAGLTGCALSLFWIARLNLEAGYWDWFWPQFGMGIALGLIFVPLTTITMDPIPRETMGNATSLFNLMRNIGGSLGIALSTTLVARKQQAFTQLIGGHVTPYDPVSRQALEQAARLFERAGADPATAAHAAQQTLFGRVLREAALLGYLDTFRLLGLVFLAIVPLVALMRSPARRGGLAALH